MKNLRTFILFISFICTVTAVAQIELGGKVEVAQPKFITDRVYKSDLPKVMNYKENSGGKEKSGGKEEYWNVISDRSNNTTYSSPNSSAPKYGTLDFNEAVRIAKIENGYALVYTDVKDAVCPEITKKATSLGWVPMENLLLWRRCPIDSYGIYDKAMIAVNLDEISPSGSDDLAEKNLLRRDPNSKSDQLVVSSQQIFFVMKELRCNDGKKRLLLSNTSRLEGLEAKRLMGWVDEVNVSRWTQRSCLEREWDERTIEKKLEGEQLKIYESPNNQDIQIPIWTWSMSSKDGRADGNTLRFPILDDQDHKDQYKLTFYGSIGDGKNSIKRKEEANKRITEEMGFLRNINIILVIDGTESMQNYYAPVKKAIQKSIQSDLKDFNVKVGVVIYRDSINGKYLTEVCPMKAADDPRLNDFLNTGGEYGITHTAADRTMEEDMYTGIDVALDWRKMGYGQKENNIMMIVGDCGNPRVDEAKWHSRLVDKLVENNMQVIAFQVNAGETGAYGYFRMQLQKLIKDNFEKQYTTLAKGAGITDVKLGKLKELPDQSGRQYELPSKEGVNNRFFFAVMRYPKVNGPADPALIGQLILNNIGDYGVTATENYNTLQRFVAGIEDSKSTEGKFSEAFVRKRVGDQLFKEFKEYNTTMAVTGYTKRYNRDGESLWRPVIFISEKELASMMGDLKKVYIASKAESRDRSKYVDALTSVVKAMVPEAQKNSEILDENVKKVTLGEITAMVAGLNVKTEAIGADYSLIDLMDPKVVSDDDFNEILHNFKTKYQKLENVQKKAEYLKDFGNEKYFWIPVDFLP